MATPTRPRRAHFKEEASLTNFFYGFLIKGLGAEIFTPKDGQKSGGRMVFGCRIWTIFDHGGPVQAAGTVWERVRI
jgi:hypothetical protein